MNRVSQRQLFALGLLVVAAFGIIAVFRPELPLMVALVAYAIGAGYLLLSSGGDGGSSETIETIASSVRRIWKTHGLQPHRCRQFKLSNDPKFVAKLRDVVGLYVDPPAHAIVLSVDEKSQIQALDRTQPGLPLKKGRLGTMTHDYKRHGTTTLFAALNVLDGTVIGRNMQRHRHQELIRFLNTIEAEVPVGKMVHVILDNYAAHKHPKVRAWLERACAAI